jgi:quinol monooxygenase YgiN
MIVQIVRVSIKPEQRDRWLELNRVNAAQTRAEKGCESYRVCEDIEIQNAFVIVEEWSDIDAQYEHFRNPEFGTLMGSIQEVLAGPPEAAIHDVAATQTLDEALDAAGVAGN